MKNLKLLWFGTPNLMERHSISVIIISGVLLLNSLATSAQFPGYQWAKSAGETGWDEGTSVATDANGNVFVTGYFQGPSITFGATTLTNVGSVDMFIVKYDPTGSVLWATSAGGTSNDGGSGIAVDANGNVLVTGYFNSPTITFGTTTLTTAGSSDIFIVKYDPNGNVLWAKSAGAASVDAVNSVAADATGNIFLTGIFRSPAITFGTTTLTNAGTGNDDMFIVKYDNNGNVLWAERAGGTDEDWGYSVATDANGNSLVTGYFNSSTITFGTTTLLNAGTGMSDMFVVKYDSNGNVLWARRAGGADTDFGNSVATDANGNIIIIGYFLSPSITFGTTTLTNTGGYDFFLLKYDSNGNVLWATSATGVYDDIGASVATDVNGNILVTGYFTSSTITFGATTLTNASLGYEDMFIVKYDGGGNVLWATSAGGAVQDKGNAVAAGATGNILVTGTFNGASITFGPTTLTNVGSYDMFIVKIDDALVGTNTWEARSEQVSIFPNPAQNSITISCESQQTIEFFDVLGQKITSTLINPQEKTTINISSFPNVFFVRTERGVKKIVRVK